MVDGSIERSSGLGRRTEAVALEPTCTICLKFGIVIISIYMDCITVLRCPVLTNRILRHGGHAANVPCPSLTLPKGMGRTDSAGEQQQKLPLQEPKSDL